IWIYAIPLFPTTGHLPETALRDNGQFTLANLAPGSYRVVACDAAQEIDFHSQEGLAAWSGKGQVVTVDPNGTANVELTVIHGDVAP
ncbi:MAG: carboxypeptidase-like regulatory domain-containing protein, partial [Acidobacteriaceae bacterium]